MIKGIPKVNQLFGLVTLPMANSANGSEIRRSPVEVFSGLSHYLQVFVHPNGGWFGISEPSTVVSNKHV